MIESIGNRREAIAAVRAEADALIEQSTRRAQGMDKGAWRDDMRIVDRNTRNTIAATRRAGVALAFALSAKFAGGGK